MTIATFVCIYIFLVESESVDLIKNKYSDVKGIERETETMKQREDKDNANKQRDI